MYRPFDVDLYEDEGDEDEILDEEGRARLKLKVINFLCRQIDIFFLSKVLGWLLNIMVWVFGSSEAGI